MIELLTRRIDLHVPHSWQTCTAEDLEKLIIAHKKAKLFPVLNTDDAAKVMQWKLNCFIELTGLEMVEGVKPEVPVEEQYVTVRKQISKNRWAWLPWVPKEESEPFVLYLWQIQYWIKQYLAWLDIPPAIVQFPYPTWRWRWQKFQGPSVYMAQWSWTQYRLAQDYLQYYMKTVEQAEKHSKRSITPEEQNKLQKQIRTAKSLFLATIYNRKVRTIDEENMRHKCDYTYISNQHTDNSKAFRNFPENQFQVILLWWESMMQYLHHTYPKCFGKDDKTPKQKSNPLQLYSRLTATMEKYMHIDERQLGRETFANVLQHLNDLVVKNETIDKMNKKAKKKG